MNPTAIHQPNFIPWLGYFAKMARAETFVLLDDVEYTKNSFINRNRIKTPQGELFLTVPVKYSGHSESPIREIQIADPRALQKIAKSIEGNYRRAPHWGEISTPILEVLAHPHESLSELNCAMIQAIARILQLTPRFVKSSELGASGTKSDRLVSILNIVKSSRYIAGSGGASYHDEETFSTNKISIEFVAKEYPVYPQLWGAFIPNLSILDPLFNIGSLATAKLILP